MKKVQKFIPFLSAVLLFCIMSVTAFAAGEVPDVNRKGSIAVTIRDTKSKKPVSGGKLKLYQVASVRIDDGNYMFEYTDDFSDCGLALDDIESEDLAAELADYASGRKLKGTDRKVGSDGKVKFGGLELGLYLVVQSTAAENYSALNPFLVSVPMKDGDSLIYAVNATPKAGTVAKTANPDPKPDSGSGKHKHSGSSGNNVSVPASAPQLAALLPQTGQLWWPVPLLAMAGILFVMIGWMKRKDEKD